MESRTAGQIFNNCTFTLNYTAHADLGHPRRLAAPCHSMTGNVPLVQYDTIDYINMHPKADE